MLHEDRNRTINPKKSLSGRRFYSSNDIEKLLKIKKLLYEDGFTIKGAVSMIDKKNQQNEEIVVDDKNMKLHNSINLIQQGLSLIKKNMD